MSRTYHGHHVRCDSIRYQNSMCPPFGPEIYDPARLERLSTLATHQDSTKPYLSQDLSRSTFSFVARSYEPPSGNLGHKMASVRHASYQRPVRIVCTTTSSMGRTGRHARDRVFRVGDAAKMIGSPPSRVVYRLFLVYPHLTLF